MLAASVLIGSVTIGACGGTDTAPRGMGTLVVQLTDAPFPTDSVKSVDIFVVRVDGRVGEVDEATTDAHVEQSDPRATVEDAGHSNASINLLALQNGVVSTVGEARCGASYRGFRLVIDPTKSSVTLKERSEC
jgi:hypothetical protein